MNDPSCRSKSAAKLPARPSALVLCGGRSTRMGCDKALLPFGPHETLLQRAVRLVGEVVPFEEIVCVAAADQMLPDLPTVVEIIRDPYPCRGPLAGLTAGLAVLAARKADTVFACGCDMPLVVPAFIEQLFTLLGDASIAAPHDGERFHPLAAVYRTRILPLAEALVAAGERSLLALLEKADTKRIDLESLRGVDPLLDSIINCNSVEEYYRLLARAGFRQSL